MASTVFRRSRRRRTPLFDGPVVFKRSRRRIIELVAIVWLLAKFAPHVRSFFESPRRGSPVA